MKKILTALIVIALLTATFALVSCQNKEHVHSFTETVVKPTCSLEGYTEYTCSCGYVYRDTVTEPDGKTHTFGAYVTTKEATCSEKGSKYRECTSCGKQETVTIKVLNHTYGPDVVTLAPTCTEKGTKTNECTVCGNVKSTAINATGHTWLDWVDDKEANCDGEFGYRHRVCETCGLEEGEIVLPHVADEDIAPVVTAPTCCTVGYTTYVCDLCGEEYDRDFKKATGKHSFGEWEDHPEFSNLQVRYCKDCEYYETKEKK